MQIIYPFLQPHMVGLLSIFVLITLIFLWLYLAATIINLYEEDNLGNSVKWIYTVKYSALLNLKPDITDLFKT